MNENANAAHDLEGLTLSSGWKVIKKIEKNTIQTGAFFSVLYYVEKDDETCFMKAFDFSKFSSLSESLSMVDTMSYMLDAFRFERDLSFLCKQHYVTKIAFVRDAGEERIKGYEIPVVPYLIFDLAEGDVRVRLQFSNDLDFAWKLNSLHSIAVGLRQLHKIDVSHQDIKPSNVLIFHEESKIGDLGRSMSKELKAPHDSLVFSGQKSYAPPEILYGFYSHDWSTRLFGIDCYLFGSLIVFYFSGTTINALIRNHLPDSVSWENWKGSDLNEIKSFLIDAFQKATDEFVENIEGEYFKAELKKLVIYLCYPIPEKRGHPKTVSSIGSNFNLERIITRLDLLAKTAQSNIIR